MKTIKYCMNKVVLRIFKHMNEKFLLESDLQSNIHKSNWRLYLIFFLCSLQSIFFVYLRPSPSSIQVQTTFQCADLAKLGF